MRAIASTLGYVIFFGSGIAMFLFWFVALVQWLGPIFGGFVGILASPGVVIFPVVYWIVEGVFPTLYFALWGIGVAGGIIGGIASEDA